VGYTNAGKSTLLRALTGADAHVEDKLFATLDTQTRSWKLPGSDSVFLSDTVGFIQDLPHHLVASFRSTLAEAVEADLLLHVVDASSPDAERHVAVVDRTLEEIGAGANRRLLVLNKWDAVPDPLLGASMLERSPGAIAVSARSGAGLDDLAARVSTVVRDSQPEEEFVVPAAAGRALSMIAARGNVVEQVWDGDSVRVRVRASARDLARIREELANPRKRV
jgi:GTP-binding protein HflX